MDRKKKRRIAAILVVAAACAACGGDDRAPAPARPAVAAVPAAPPAPAKVERPRRAAMAAPEIAGYRALLHDGRRAVQAKEYAAGIALYEKALAVRPGDPRLLIELGWAAFLAGDLDRAERATRQGLLGAREAEPRGAALYNLGRIAEQRGALDEAAARYRESLGLRQNATVEKRLAGLGAAAAAPAPTAAPSETGPLAGPLPDLKAVCDALVAENAQEESALGCGGGASRILEIGEGGIARALLLPVWRDFMGGGGGLDTAPEVMWYLVVETDRGLFRTGAWIAYVYNPGAFGIYEEVELELSLDDLVPGAPREIVVRAKHLRHDSDLGILEEESEEREWLLVCGAEGGAPVCYDRIQVRYAFERAVMDLGGEGGEPVEHTPGLPIRSSYRYDVEFDGAGGYAVTAAEPPVGEPQAPGRVGRFALR